MVDDCVKPFHKSLHDWLVSEDADDYLLDPQEGHQILSRTGWLEFEAGPSAMSDHVIAHLPGHLERMGSTDKLKECVTSCEHICRLAKTDRLCDLSPHWKQIEKEQLASLCRESWAKMTSPLENFGLLVSRSIGKLFLHAGDYQTALEFFERELKIAEEVQDQESAAEAFFDIGWCHRHADCFDQAIENVSKAKRFFEKADKKPGLAKCLSVIGICFWHKQNDSLAMENLRWSLKAYQETDDCRGQAEASNHLGIVLRSVGRFGEALCYLTKSKQAHQTLKHRNGFGKCCNSMGTCLWWSGDLEGALASYEEANQANIETGNLYVLGLTANNLGYIHLEKGDMQKARSAFKNGLKIRQQLGSESYEMMDLSGLPRVEFQEGNVALARELSSRAVTTLAKHDTVEDLRRAYYNHHLTLKGGNDEERGCAEKALTKAKELVKARLGEITDAAVRKNLEEKVPVVKEILEAPSMHSTASNLAAALLQSQQPV